MRRCDICGYIGQELVQKARAIRDLETDLAELVREAAPGLVTRAREVLAGDAGALAVLEGVVGVPEMDKRAREMPWLLRAREGVAE